MKKIKKKKHILFTPLVSSRIKFKSLMLNKYFVHEGKKYQTHFTGRIQFDMQT